MATEDIRLNRLEDYLWEIPRQGGMRVPGRIYASEKLMAGLRADNSLKQVMNVAYLPGIVGYSLAMPDIHWGYGFPIGGVAAVKVDDGSYLLGVSVTISIAAFVWCRPVWSSKKSKTN